MRLLLQEQAEVLDLLVLARHRSSVLGRWGKRANLTGRPRLRRASPGLPPEGGNKVSGKGWFRGLGR